MSIGIVDSLLYNKEEVCLQIDVTAVKVLSVVSWLSQPTHGIPSCLSEILGASSRVATSLDLDLAFGAIDVNDDLACISLLSPVSPLPPPIASPPSSAAAGEPIWDPRVLTFFPFWWLS